VAIKALLADWIVHVALDLSAIIYLRELVKSVAIKIVLAELVFNVALDLTAIYSKILVKVVAVKTVVAAVLINVAMNLSALTQKRAELAKSVFNQVLIAARHPVAIYLPA